MTDPIQIEPFLARTPPRFLTEPRRTDGEEADERSNLRQAFEQWTRRLFSARTRGPV